MSEWNHVLCDQCYQTIEPDRVPVKVNEEVLLACCRCGEPADGIFYRAAPDSYPCEGVHADED